MAGTQDFLIGREELDRTNSEMLEQSGMLGRNGRACSGLAGEEVNKPLGSRIIAARRPNGETGERGPVRRKILRVDGQLHPKARGKASSD